MDYGVHLKQTLGNNISQSKHYARQSKFEGSRRQVRGTIIRQLLGGPMELQDVLAAVSDERAESVIGDLAREGFLSREADQLRLTGELKLP
jgi:A/G-specific adenine glycosylase